MAEPDGGKPLRLSWSRLKDWEECQAKAHAKAQGKQAELRDSRVYFPGTVVDRVMRAWLEADEQVPGAMVAMVEEVLDREERLGKETGDGVVLWKGPGDKRQVTELCRECVTRLEPILFEHVVPYEYQTALRFEVPLQVPHPDGSQRQVMLIGEMDLLVRHQDRSWVRVKDLKMTKNNDYWRQTYPQLVFYELAAWVLTKQWPDQSWLIQPMAEPRHLPFVFTIEHRREMLGRVVRWAEGQWSGKYPPKGDNRWCSSCTVIHACPRYTSAGRRVQIGTS